MVTDSKHLHIPAWAAGQIRRDDLAKVAAAVMNAEVKTNAEIVPMIVRSSAVSGHIPVLLTLIYVVIVAGFWSVTSTVIGNHWVLAPLIVIIGIVFIQLSRVPSVFRLLTDDDDIERQALRRAELEFYRADMKNTAGGTGILLFVSLAEHEAVVLADKAIAEKLPRDTWKKVCDTLVAAARQKTLGQGLVDAISQCGDLCATHFPPVGTNPNELRNALIIKE